MRALILSSSAFLLLAACGQSNEAPADQGSGAPAPAASSSPEPMTPVPVSEIDEAERTALLASLPAPYNEGDLENGRRVFARCRSCHTVIEGGPNMIGPNLWRLFGRKAGSHANYAYSNALKAADFDWDAEHLDHWLDNPRTFLPGNKMSFAGIRDTEDRRDLIAWLKVETGYQPH